MNRTYGALMKKVASIFFFGVLRGFSDCRGVQ